VRHTVVLAQGHYTTSEDTLQSYVQECERVKLLLVEEQVSATRIKKEVDRMETEMKEQRNRLDNQMKVSNMDKVTNSFLYIKLTCSLGWPRPP